MRNDARNPWTAEPRIARGHDTLFIKGTTLDFNPTFDQREIDRAMEEDPDAARAEYLGEFRSDLEALFSIERIADAPAKKLALQHIYRIGQGADKKRSVDPIRL